MSYTFNDFLLEKHSSYSKETLTHYEKEYKKGKEIPIGVSNSLKARGIIPRANGKVQVSDKYKTLFDRVKEFISPKDKKGKHKKPTKEVPVSGATNTTH